jgi:hypothetical protein
MVGIFTDIGAAMGWVVALGVVRNRTSGRAESVRGEIETVVGDCIATTTSSLIQTPLLQAP